MNYTKISLDDETFISDKSVACIGYFDGLHLGHQVLIEKCIIESKIRGCKSKMITFSPDPWAVIKEDVNIKNITPLNKRIKLAKQLGIDDVIVVDFTKQLSLLGPQVFISKIIEPCNLAVLICGFDFHFGYQGSGDINFLKEYTTKSFELLTVDEIKFNSLKISSTRITKFIEDGHIKDANVLLGYTYNIEGRVIYGKQKGTLIGFPTANIEINENYVIPKNGVYQGLIEIDNIKYKAMINVGHNPTINYIKEISIEAHILDFNENIYSKNVSLYFLEYLREEKKFESVDLLIDQLNKDKINVIENFRGTNI
ncbi:MAG: bifunctional riboflavin kinase/FAD synthetase [Anaerorhabdus sp.]